MIENPLCIVMLGPPASGKGTQAHRLAAMLGARTLSTGALLREAIAARSPIGIEAEGYMSAGELVPDAVMIALVRVAISAIEARTPLILDGFPRTLPQAEALETLLPPDRAILIEIDDAEVIRRISGRRVGPGGESFHLVFNPPPVGLPVVQRADDREVVVRERLEVYRRQTEPLLEHYERRAVLVRIDGRGTIDEVFAGIVSSIPAPFLQHAAQLPRHASHNSTQAPEPDKG